jgi:putative PIN family toxin of toxin-antitoxin system
MPPCAVLDSTVLVSAFLTPGGAADALVDQAKAGRIIGAVAEEILAETARVLLTAERIRLRYPYTDADVQDYLQSIRQAALIVADLPPLSGLVRDPNDDMVLACAVAAEASYVVTRDDDLLSLGNYAGAEIVSPEALLTVLRTTR